MAHSQPTTVFSDEDFIHFLGNEEAILASFKGCRHWQDKYRQILLLGKRLGNNLPQLQDQQRLDEHARVRGCESKAWLYHRKINDKHYFIAAADAKIIRGLIYLLLTKCQGKSDEQLLGFDPNHYFDELGIKDHLSPSRTNGLYALSRVIFEAATS